MVETDYFLIVERHEEEEVKRFFVSATNIPGFMAFEADTVDKIERAAIRVLPYLVQLEAYFETH